MYDDVTENKFDFIDKIFDEDTVPPMEFGYYKMKGVAESIRWLYHYCDMNVKEWNPTSDLDAKKKLRELDTLFPDFPYLKDNKTVITNINAIPYYLLEKHQLYDMMGKD